MNTNLQIALAKDHQQSMLSRAAAAQRASAFRSDRSRAATSTAHAGWLRSLKLRTSLIRRGASNRARMA
jgi:hypothetical protein